jgi:imidazole glycerol-phosphate synthase subunit HisH
VTGTAEVVRPRIAIIDYGIGNLRSAEKALIRAGADAFLTQSPADVESADGVVLPGVGAMGRCMDALSASGLQGAAESAIGRGLAGERPFLGVCVGMQMLHAGSDEYGGVVGLGVFASQVRLMHPAAEVGGAGSNSGSAHRALKVPHMQWNKLQVAPEKVSWLLEGLAAESWMYFVHSFAADQHPDVVGTCTYGGSVVAAVERGDVAATQFHPEKSGADGIALLGSFVKRCVTRRDGLVSL